MNIAFLTNTYPPDPGGLAVSAQRLAQGLAATGYIVHLCAPADKLAPGQVERHSPAPGLTVHRFGRQRRPDDTGADWFDLVVELHRQQPFDLLHGYYLAGAGFVTVYTGRYLHRPAIVSARGNDLERAVFHPGQGGPILWALQQAAAITTVSHDLARKARALAPERPVTVVANGVDTDLFCPGPAVKEAELCAAFDIPTGVARLGFVGEARLKKGLGVLLPAFAAISRRLKESGQPRPILLLVGGVRRDDADLLKLFKAQNPDCRVRRIPYTALADLPDWYRLLDLLLLPSLRDGLPNALLEGLACARPVVASAVGGIPDVVGHGENGLLVPPGDPAALAEAALALLADPARARALGQAGRQTVEQAFTPAAELEKNLALYRSLLGAAGQISAS